MKTRGRGGSVKSRVFMILLLFTLLAACHDDANDATETENNGES